MGKTMVRVVERNPAVQKQLKFTIDLGIAYEDDLVVPKEFLDFLKSNMKVNGKKGNLGENVTLVLNGSKINVTSNLKKSDILEYLKVIATDKNTYRIKYSVLDQDEGE